MRKSTFRYLFVIAFAALAVQACAKKDTALSARAQGAKDKATAEKLAAEKLAAEKTGGKLANDTAAPETKADVDQVRQETCANPILMEAYGDDKDAKIEDIITRDKSELQLQTMTVYIASKAKTGGIAQSFHLEGTVAETPADLKKEVALSNKSTLVCHTVAKLKATDKWDMPTLSVPNSISTEDGKVSAVRSDLVSFTSDAVSLKAKLQVADGTLEAWIKSIPDAKVLIVRNADHDFTIKIQFKSENQLTTADQTYALHFVKKEAAEKVAPVETETKKVTTGAR